MKHKDFAIQKSLALACQREMVMTSGDSVQASRNLKMNWQTFKWNLRWIETHHDDPVFEQLLNQEHDDVMLLKKFGYPSVENLRDDMVSHHHALGKLSKFKGTNNELRKLIELAGLEVAQVGDRPYVHWKHIQQP